MNENGIKPSLKQLYDKVTRELEDIKSKKMKSTEDIEQIALKSREQSRLFREQVKYNIDNHLTL